jgi:ComF family protein
METAARVTRQLYDLFLELMFPPRCAACKRGGVYFCSDCLTRLEPLAAERCPRCDDALDPSARRYGRECARCYRQFPSVHGLRLFGAYETPLKEAIQTLKYERFPALAEPLGQRLAAEWLARGEPVDGVIPVPLHAERLRERGYNQSTLLAEVVCREHGLPLQEGYLARTRPTRPQVGLSRGERLTNVRGAFAAEPAVARGRWLLVDDVCTTGATLEGCAAALRAQGAEAVWALVLARPAEGHDGP